MTGARIVTTVVQKKRCPTQVRKLEPGTHPLLTYVRSLYESTEMVVTPLSSQVDRFSEVSHAQSSTS